MATRIGVSRVSGRRAPLPHASSTHVGSSPLRACLRAAGVDAGRALMVGDSLRHDILGAAAAGLDSLFVVDSGVHATDMAEVSEKCVARLAAAEDVPVPTFVMRKFRW